MAGCRAGTGAVFALGGIAGEEVGDSACHVVNLVLDIEGRESRRTGRALNRWGEIVRRRRIHVLRRRVVRRVRLGRIL
jgi:hypothetical protein